jgi:hypothetical protein
MPFVSKKQRTFLAINRPDIYKKWKAEYGTKIKKAQPKSKAKGK